MTGSLSEDARQHPRAASQPEASGGGSGEEEGLPERLGAGRYRTHAPAQTEALGRCLGAVLEPGDLVILSGDLGAGKTCFVGGVSAALGDVRAVTSPTFTIMSVHDTGRIPLYHFDLYRLDDPGELGDVGIYDALEDDGACLVEWGERFSDELGDDKLELVFSRETAASEAPAPQPQPRLRSENDSDEAAWRLAEPARLIAADASGKRSRELLAAFDGRVASMAG
jgi:tRNA threonylcarbamoyladenosine biosynthesis protein TsaE